ncbi:hypothetical protein WICPIJ_000223 [Wickerhamomyces pijperi]|uniref:Uncharacterized protein n=1 Tax=Wickerhamomyces pijperi TaxID=599730 RepID=A0A9P8QHL6_WICPI|nr:hypothetical protein WICPIJ_000223 [Wickerhamomyces pijperi]
MAITQIKLLNPVSTLQSIIVPQLSKLSVVCPRNLILSRNQSTTSAGSKRSASTNRTRKRPSNNVSTRHPHTVEGVMKRSKNSKQFDDFIIG